MVRFVSSSTDWHRLPPLDTDWLRRGRLYCQQVQTLIPSPLGAADLNITAQQLIWIGQQIHHLNQRLWQLTLACYDCFFENTCPAVQTWAFPLSLVMADQLQVVGFCSLEAVPTALLIDVGRFTPMTG